MWLWTAKTRPDLEFPEKAKYLYCFCGGSEKRSLKAPGVPGVPDGSKSPRVFILPYQDIGAVVSDIESEVVRATSEICMRHEKVLEETMRHLTILPFEFGTVAPNAPSVAKLLELNYRKIKELLKKLEGKVELNVKAVWSKMETIFQEILEEHRMIAHFKEEIQSKPPDATYSDRIKIGQMVGEALRDKKEKEGRKIIQRLRQYAVDDHMGHQFGDSMIFNASFLVKKGKNREAFEETLNEIDQENGGRINFKYTNGLPPYSFVDLKLRVK